MFVVAFPPLGVKTMKKIRLCFGMFVALAFLVGSAFQASASRKIRFVSAKKKPIAESELAWKKPTKTEAQTWILWGWNDKGYMVTAFLISTRFLFVSRLGVQLTLHLPSGKVKHLVKEYTMDKVKGKSKRLFLQVNKQHTWDGNQKKGTVSINYGKWGCKLTYKRTLQGYRHMNGTMKMGSSIFKGITFGPRLEVSGTLKVNGKTVKFQGLGYADYSHQTITPKNLARRWYAARAAGPEYTVLAHHLLTVKKWRPYSLPGISIARNGKWEFVSVPRHIQYFRAYHVKVDKKAKYKVPMRVLYKARSDNGTKYKVDIKHKKQYVRLDLLGHVNPFLKFFIKRLLSNPFVFRYKAEMELEIKPKGKKTIRKQLTAYTEWLFVQ